MGNERALIVSSDGHATAKMEDYEPYLPQRSREGFKDFCKEFAERGSKNFEPRALSVRLDAKTIDDWKTRFIDSGRLDGNSDPALRIKEDDSEGVTAEIIFPDFGVPFEMLSPTASGAQHRTTDWRTPEQIVDGDIAFNRWLADFISYAPDRWAGMAKVNWDDVDSALAEIRWAREHGLRGILLGHMDDNRPVYHPDYDPIWSLCEELEMPVNAHSGMSSITRRRPALPTAAHPAMAAPILSREFFFNAQQLLVHFVYGGVFNRHPKLKVVFTEMGSAWIGPLIDHMEYNRDGSYMRSDVLDVLTRRPAEYVEDHVWLGSSIFSKAEVMNRNVIGAHKMMLGMDFPHHEGVLASGPGTQGYLRATLGAAQVPVDEARAMLGGSAIEVFGFDKAKLQPIADRVGPDLKTLLTPPETDEFPKGDVKKPLLYV